MLRLWYEKRHTLHALTSFPARLLAGLYGGESHALGKAVCGGKLCMGEEQCTEKSNARGMGESNPWGRVMHGAWGRAAHGEEQCMGES